MIKGKSNITSFLSSLLTVRREAELAGGGTTVKTWFGVYLPPPLSPPGGAGWATGKL